MSRPELIGDTISEPDKPKKRIKKIKPEKK